MEEKNIYKQEKIFKVEDNHHNVIQNHEENSFIE
jgi:hypothetical protein